MKTIPNIMANKASIREATPTARLPDLKPCATNHIPKNIIPTPAMALTVKTLIKGNIITIKPNRIPKIPIKTFFCSFILNSPDYNNFILFKIYYT